MGHADNIGLVQITAVGVYRNTAIDPRSGLSIIAQLARKDIIIALPFFTKAVIFKLPQHHPANMLLEHPDIHTSRAKARLPPYTVSPEIVPRARKIGIRHTHPRNGSAPCPLSAMRTGMDNSRLVPTVFGAVHRGRNDRNRTIGFKAEIKAPERVGKH